MGAGTASVHTGVHFTVNSTVPEAGGIFKKKKTFPQLVF